MSWPNTHRYVTQSALSSCCRHQVRLGCIRLEAHRIIRLALGHAAARAVRAGGQLTAVAAPQVWGGDRRLRGDHEVEPGAHGGVHRVSTSSGSNRPVTALARRSRQKRSGPSISSEALWSVDLVRTALARSSRQNRSGPSISPHDQAIGGLASAAADAGVLAVWVPPGLGATWQEKKLLLDETVKRRLALEPNVTLIVSRTDNLKYMKLVKMLERLRPDVGIIQLASEVCASSLRWRLHSHPHSQFPLPLLPLPLFPLPLFPLSLLPLPLFPLSLLPPLPATATAPAATSLLSLLLLPTAAPPLLPSSPSRPHVHPRTRSQHPRRNPALRALRASWRLP
eukprot:1179388-Prorocentrum_minimum.AAC.1